MLAQGHSSSAKRGGLVADVSSWLIFLKKKKKERKEITVWMEDKEGGESREDKVKGRDLGHIMATFLSHKKQRIFSNRSIKFWKQSHDVVYIRLFSLF